MSTSNFMDKPELTLEDFKGYFPLEFGYSSFGAYAARSKSGSFIFWSDDFAMGSTIVRALNKLALNEPCRWAKATFDGWVTPCSGGLWYSENGEPSEKDLKFCPFCGKRIEEIKND
jgi:hypothetical protein